MTTRPHQPTDLETIRRRLASALLGKGDRHLLCEAPAGPFRQKVPVPFSEAEYWRRLEELADAEGVGELLHGRYTGQAPPGHDGLSRRRFLTLMAASLGLAGLTGCNLQPPTEMIVPYVRAPEELIPGKPLYYATTMTLGGVAVGLLVESHEGRPTKIEGNPLHPASMGAAEVLAQASVLSLYDPDRSQTVLYRGQIRAWDDALEAIAAGVAAQRESKAPGCAC